MPKYSIIIPIYNTAKSLAKCLDSVISQTFTDYEIVAVNDGSTDDSADVLQDYLGKITLVDYGENKGLLSARLHGIKASKGDYIIHLDSDDYLEVGALSKLDDFINSHKDEYDIIEYGFIRRPENKTVIHAHDTNNRIQQLLIHEYPPTVWNKCYSRDIVNRALELIEDYYCVFTEDCYQSIAFALCNPRYGYIDEAFMSYVTTDGVSNNKAVTKASLQRSIDSLLGSSNRVQELIKKLRPDMTQYLDTYYLHSADFLRRQFMNEEVSYEDQFEFLGMLDKAFGTEYVKGLFESSGKYNAYKKLGRKAKISVCMKEIKRIFK